MEEGGVEGLHKGGLLAADGVSFECFASISNGFFTRLRRGFLGADLGLYIRIA
jgi:hypothetical protein